MKTLVKIVAMTFFLWMLVLNLVNFPIELYAEDHEAATLTETEAYQAYAAWVRENSTAVLSAEQWIEFHDAAYGYTIQIPKSWQVFQSEGRPGTLTSVGNYDFENQLPLVDSVRIDIGVASNGRDIEIPLAEWSELPVDVQAILSVSDDRPSFYGPDLVIEAFVTNSGNTVRRAYVPRNNLVYFLDLYPDESRYDALFLSVLQSFLFSAPYEQSLTPTVNMYEAPEQVRGAQLFLPFIGHDTAFQPQRIGRAVDVLTPVAVPHNYRLPFIGEYLITQGPGCWRTHQGNDFEALDFSTPSGTRIYASESGLLTNFSDLGGYGHTVKISHSDGRVSWYTHLRRFNRQNGRVSKNANIGDSGGHRNDIGRGNSTGAHLHFMIQASGQRKTESIRQLPGITWFSGDYSKPCNSGQYGYPLASGGYADGKAVGPPLGEEEVGCAGPSLSSPDDGATVNNAQVTFNWQAPGGCQFQGYTFRIKTVSSMDSGGTTLIDTGEGGTSRTETIAAQYHNQDLYWGVRAANAPSGASWSVRRFRVQGTSIAPTPTNRVAFVSDRDGNHEIYSMRVDGTNVVRLTHNQFNDQGPTWSPNGKRIAFHSNRDGWHQLYAMDSDGSNPVRLLHSSFIDEWAQWSPDGNNIAFSRIADFDGTGTRSEVMIMSQNGSGVSRITYSSGATSGFSHGCWPSGWTPDSLEIMFYCYQGGSNQLWISGADGSNQQRLLDDQLWNAIPTMSSNGLTFAFASYRDGNYEIYTGNRNSTQVSRLTNNSQEDWRPVWIENGNAILFESRRTGSTQIYRMQADGSQQLPITSGSAYNGQPAWWP